VSDEAQERRRVELNLDADTAKGRYANATVVSQGQHEVVLDFVAALPHHKPQVVARVVLPRAQAQALTKTLERTLAANEGAKGPAARRTTRKSDGEPN
jgi:hypothetical protein